MKDLLKELLLSKYRTLMRSIDLFVKCVAPLLLVMAGDWSGHRFNQHTVPHLVIAGLSFLVTYLLAAVWLRGGWGGLSQRRLADDRMTGYFKTFFIWSACWFHAVSLATHLAHFAALKDADPATFGNVVALPSLVSIGFVVLVLKTRPQASHAPAQTGADTAP